MGLLPEETAEINTVIISRLGLLSFSHRVCLFVFLILPRGFSSYYQSNTWFPFYFLVLKLDLLFLIFEFYYSLFFNMSFLFLANAVVSGRFLSPLPLPL